MRDGGDERLPWGPDEGERVTRLKKLWTEEGRSGSEIASILGGTTRNAVLAKLDRLGLLTRTNSSVSPTRVSTRRPPKPRRFVPAMSVAVEAMPMPAERFDVPPERRVKLIDLESHHCRWPLGDPKDADFGFCGARKHPASMYCEPHFRASVEPPRLGRSPKSEIADPRQTTSNRRVA